MSVKLVAHRGESLAAPENTLESFSLAWLRGATCVEGDFHLTGDGEIVCMHDDNAARTCGVARPLAEMTLAEIKQLDAGNWKGPAWQYTRVPTLTEVLRTMPDYGEIFIELKSTGPILDRLEAIFAAGPWRPEQLTFIAFDEVTISTVKRLFPSHHAYWLLCNWQGNWQQRGAMRYTPEELANQVVRLGVDGVDIHPDFLTREHVDAVHRVGGAVHVWTVDEVDEARRLIAMQVDSLTTNRAYALSRELADSPFPLQ